jgi:ParB family chromosome partitioning protein
VPAVVHEVDDRDTLVLALVENVVREDLNPLETARAYQSLLDEHDVTAADLARALGKSRPAVANTLRLLELPDDVLEAVSAGRLSEGHGRALLQSPDRSAQRRLARCVLDRGLSVRATEAMVRADNEGASTPVASRPRRTPTDPQLQEAFDRVVDSLTVGVTARLKVGQRSTKVELSCADGEALHGLLETLAEAFGERLAPPHRSVA